MKVFMMLLVLCGTLTAQTSKTIKQNDEVILKSKAVTTMTTETGATAPLPPTYKMFYNIEVEYSNGSREMVMNRLELFPGEDDTLRTILSNTNVNKIVGVHKIECWPLMHIPTNEPGFQDKIRPTRRVLTLTVEAKNDNSMPSVWEVIFP